MLQKPEVLFLVKAIHQLYNSSFIYILSHMLCAYHIQLSKVCGCKAQQKAEILPVASTELSYNRLYRSKHKILYFPNHQVEYKTLSSAHKINIYQIL